MDGSFLVGGGNHSGSLWNATHLAVAQSQQEHAPCLSSEWEFLIVSVVDTLPFEQVSAERGVETRGSRELHREL